MNIYNQFFPNFFWLSENVRVVKRNHGKKIIKSFYVVAITKRVNHDSSIWILMPTMCQSCQWMCVIISEYVNINVQVTFVSFLFENTDKYKNSVIIKTSKKLDVRGLGSVLFFPFNSDLFHNSGWFIWNRLSKNFLSIKF